MFCDGGVVDQTITRSQIAGRVDHNVTPGYIDYYIEIQQLKSHCVTMSFGFSEFKKQLENMKEFKIVYLKKNMLAKTKGPSMRVNVMQISRRIDEEDGQED
jgi:hypothetical protein